MSFARYGTTFDELSDEERTSLSKKPKAIHEEVVTDERGRRRFHGAFTGGFSAGYFNTVGSKHGWVPQTFKSTRQERAEQVQNRAEDFMDDEDLGEFGIAPQRLHTKRDFMETLGLSGGREQLAWERATVTEKSDDLASRLADIVKPVVSDSIGVRLLKKMGWRMGKGIGPTMSRRALERQKVLDAKTQGRAVKFDEKAVHEVEETAPEAQFAPDDIPSHFYTSKEDTHGLAYQALGDTAVLKQNFGQTASALKTKVKSKGIRGQAFGVGVYEDDDDDIYTNVDLSQYDYEIGAGTSTVQEASSHFDSTFVPAKKVVVQRKYFDAARPPHGFRPFHKPIPMNVKHLPAKLLEASQRLTPFQRAMFLGDRSTSVLELLSVEDRDRLKALERPAAAERTLEGTSASADVMPFEEEPMKAHRFKQYVHYLKRGLVYPQPVDLTRLEWEQELAEFKRHLTPELRALLPEVKSRQQPLVKMDLAGPIAEQLKSRFQKETHETDEDVKPTLSKDHDRIQAVRTKMFGDKTRTKYEWHPAKDLCKRFNVPNPFPQSSLVGVLELQKRGRKENLFNLGLPDTAMEFHARKQTNAEEQRQREQVAAAEAKAAREEKDARPPLDLLAAIFEDSDASSIASSSDEEDTQEVQPADAAKPEPAAPPILGPAGPPTAPSTSKVITVVDLVQDDDEFGPRLPPTFGMSALRVAPAPAPSHKKEKKRKREKKRHRTRSP